MAEAKRLDPHHNRVREILADRACTLQALLPQGDVKLKRSLLSRIGEPVLVEADMLAAVWFVADRDPDRKSRGRAIARLGKLDRLEIRARLLTILEDEGRDVSDRQAAAPILVFDHHPEAGSLRAIRDSRQ